MYKNYAHLNEIQVRNFIMEMKELEKSDFCMTICFPVCHLDGKQLFSEYICEEVSLE